MEQILYILLGALLALGGSIIVQRHQLSIDKKREDEGSLFRAAEILDQYEPYTEKSQRDEAELMRISNMIRSRHYRQLAIALIQFADRGMDVGTQTEIKTKIRLKQADIKNKIYVRINKTLFKESEKFRKIFEKATKKWEKKKNKKNG